MHCASHFRIFEAGQLGKSRPDQPVVRSGVCVSDLPEVNMSNGISTRDARVEFVILEHPSLPKFQPPSQLGRTVQHSYMEVAIAGTETGRRKH